MPDGMTQKATARRDDRQIARSAPARAPRGPWISPGAIAGLVGLGDGIVVFASGAGAIAWPGPAVAEGSRAAIVVALLAVVVSINLLRWLGCYRFDGRVESSAAVARALAAWLATIAAIAPVAWYADAASRDLRPWLIEWALSGACGIVMLRLLASAATACLESTGRRCRMVAVVGAGTLGQRLLRRVNRGEDPSIRIVGVYDDRILRLSPRCMGYAVRGTVDDLIRHAREQRIDLVVVALPGSADWRLSEIIRKLSLAPFDVSLCVDGYGFDLGSAGVSRLAGLTLLNALERPFAGGRQMAKSIEDFVLALAILALIAPLMLAIAALIKLDSPGPVLFRQKRYGFNNRLIEVFKFRTMFHDAVDANAEQLTRRDDPRVTRLGAFLRRTSLDELPQFLNVLRGEMSVVGPRPHAIAAKAGGLLYPDAVKLYHARHRVKPGITGWAQVNGWRGETRTAAQIARRVEHDLYYIENWSLLLDLKIIARTIAGGFTGRQAY